MSLDLAFSFPLHVIHHALQVANVDVRLCPLAQLEIQIGIYIFLSNMRLSQILHV